MSTLSVGTIRSNTSAPPTVQNTSGTEIGTFCRAWVNFNGTGTVAIRASFNVSSITDNGVGDYTVNYTTAMPDANYATYGITEGVAATNTTNLCVYTDISGQSTSSVRVLAINNSNAVADRSCVSVVISR